MTGETISAIGEACAGLGISCPPSDVLVFDGKIHRFHDPLHDKHGERNGWFKGCENGDGSYGGTVGHWRLGTQANWSSRCKRKFSPEERAAYAKQMQEARRQEEEKRELLHRRISQKAASLWQRSKPATISHPYLVNKQISVHGLRQCAKQLVVPLSDTTGTIWTLQYIDPDGNKRFLKDGRMAGCYWSVGPKPSETLLIAEGMATAATLFEASGLPVAAAMNAGNLKPVALALREKYPAMLLLICADADPVGRTKAQEAAEAVDGAVIEPDFGEVANG